MILNLMDRKDICVAFMTNREFAELEFRRQKRNAYTDALIKEVRQLREENAELKAERDALKKSIAKGGLKDETTSI